MLSTISNKVLHAINQAVIYLRDINKNAITQCLMS